MLALPVRLEETKPQVTAVLRESLENTSILAKTRPGNDAKDFLGTLQVRLRTALRMQRPSCQPAGEEQLSQLSGKEALEPAGCYLLQLWTHLP